MEESQADKRHDGDRQPRAVAVAIRRDGDDVPRVTAQGRGAVAEQILRIAFDRGVKVREDADLAQILATLELDSPIPLEALAAVSEILKYIYLAQQAETAGAGALSQS